MTTRSHKARLSPILRTRLVSTDNFRAQVSLSKPIVAFLYNAVAGYYGDEIADKEMRNYPPLVKFMEEHYKLVFQRLVEDPGFKDYIRNHFIPDMMPEQSVELEAMELYTQLGL